MSSIKCRYRPLCCLVRTGTSVESAGPNPRTISLRSRPACAITGAGGKVRSPPLYSWYMSGLGVSSPGPGVLGCHSERFTSAKKTAAGMGSPCHVASARSRAAVGKGGARGRAGPVHWTHWGALNIRNGFARAARTSVGSPTMAPLILCPTSTRPSGPLQTE